MRVSLAAVLLLLSSSALAEGALEPSVRAWIRTRAREHALPGSADRALSGETLWREGPPKGLPSFTPPSSLAPLIRTVRAGVVNIRTESAKGAKGARGSRSLGSGFLINAEGLVVTNNHVIEKAERIRVKLHDGREPLARVVGRDASTDVALLALEGPLGALPHVNLGDSDVLEVGDWVVAIGNPFGLEASVSHGLISAKERVIGLGVFDDFLQTDALINPGNSGGPLFNMAGEVVGVNTAIVSQGQGIGFAVPINMVKELVPNLRDHGTFARGWLGVNIEEEARGGGAVVKDVFRGSPAEKGGLRSGDRVLAVNGRRVENYLQLLRRVAFLAPGSEARFEVERREETHQISIVLGDRPSAEALSALVDRTGVETRGLLLRELTPAVAKTLGVAPGSGVLVSGVVPASAAEASGVRAGDLVLELNRRKVSGLSDVRGALEAGGKTLLLKVQRGDVKQYVAIEP